MKKDEVKLPELPPDYEGLICVPQMSKNGKKTGWITYEIFKK